MQDTPLLFRREGWVCSWAATQFMSHPATVAALHIRVVPPDPDTGTSV